jgi:hypothetical protein
VIDRVTCTERVEPIAAALDLIPEPVRERLYFGLFTADPIFAGIHESADLNHGRSASNTAHVFYPDRPVIVLPETLAVWEAVHELGHVLHFALGDEPVLPALTDYATTNSHEAFAEAFTTWIAPLEYRVPWLQDALRRDGVEATILFDRLAA